MSPTLTAKDFAGGICGGEKYATGPNEEAGLFAYCICGWTGKIHTKGGWNAFRAQAMRDSNKHFSECDVAMGRKPAPDWGTIPHIARAENEIIHSSRSWRAVCDCGWKGTLHWSDDARELAQSEATAHMQTNPTPAPVIPDIQVTVK
jgi:hypothetical protein